ncbi:hypothetical protein [Ruegeria arenilitoris]|uniref:hypothetical protein n=1 Tax=Ruegeria arenilitoris TaxID=1173585 RepID=UPI001480C6C3|nr:hypothetical protein [Ruegeria arenilitoris]
MADIATKAFEAFAKEVRSGEFPDAEHSYEMKSDETTKFNEMLAMDQDREGTAVRKSGQRIPNGMLEDNYPRNMWWVAACRDEVTT